MEIETILADARGVEFRAKPAATRWSAWKVAALAVVTAFAGAGIAAALLMRAPPSPSREVTRFPFLLPEGQNLTAAGPASRQLVAISPDGKSFAYLANRQLYVRAMADMQSRPIPVGQVLLPFFSPSGQWIGFYQDGYLKKVAVTGGAAVQLAPVAGVPPYSASWDGNTIIFASATSGIFAVSEDGGKPEQWIKLEPGEFADSPQLLPGGKSVMFSVTKAPIGTDRWDKGDVVVVTRATGERKLLIPGGGAARYVPTGHILYALGPNLMAVRFDVQQLKIVGGPIPMIEGILRSPSMNGSSTGNFDISANGTLVYVPGSSGSVALQRVLAIVDRNGKREMLRLPPGSYDQPRASSKTRQVALTTSDDGVDSISIYDLSGTTSLRKLTLGGRSLFPRWSPDDRRLAFTGVQDGKTAIFLQNADGTGTPENLITAPGGDAYIPWSFDPAGTILAFTHCKNLADCGVFTVPLTGDKKIQTFADEPVTGQYNATFSHDGHWLAYVSNEGPTRTRHIFVQQFPSGAKYQISQVPSDAPTWSLDDKELYYYQTESAKLAAVRIQTQPEFSSGNPITLPIEGMIQAGGSPRQYDVMPDGRFLVLLPAPQAPGTEGHSRQEIDVVLNWVEELRQRLPAR
jgi:Tol biopolymer transport system component